MTSDIVGRTENDISSAFNGHDGDGDDDGDDDGGDSGGNDLYLNALRTVRHHTMSNRID